MYRAPMRSRRDDLDPWLAVERALRLGLCGFGSVDVPQRRVERFAAAADGSFVWTRDEDGLYRLGCLSGPYFYDADGADVDLVHVRPCRWTRGFDEPLPRSSSCDIRAGRAELPADPRCSGRRGVGAAVVGFARSRMTSVRSMYAWRGVAVCRHARSRHVRTGSGRSR